jgi:hypothetical protein
MSLPASAIGPRRSGVSRGTVDTVYTQLTDEGFMHQKDAAVQPSRANPACGRRR